MTTLQGGGGAPDDAGESEVLDEDGVDLLRRDPRLRPVQMERNLEEELDGLVEVQLNLFRIQGLGFQVNLLGGGFRVEHFKVEGWGQVRI